jgi:hypothetical protein
MVDGVADADLPTAQDHRHHTGPVVSSAGAVGEALQQTGLEVLDLETGRPSSGETEQDASDPERGAHGQGQQVRAARGDVLAEVAWVDHETIVKQLVEELALDQVDLAEVGLRGVGCDARTMPHGGAEVSIALHPHPSDELERWLRRLREVVARTAVEMGDLARHGTTLPHLPVGRRSHGGRGVLGSSCRA